MSLVLVHCSPVSTHYIKVESRNKLDCMACNTVTSAYAGMNLINKINILYVQLINPLKMKEQLVTQLKTQISDLERFVEFLQGIHSVHL